MQGREFGWLSLCRLAEWVSQMDKTSDKTTLQMEQLKCREEKRLPRRVRVGGRGRAEALAPRTPQSRLTSVMGVGQG